MRRGDIFMAIEKWQLLWGSCAKTETLLDSKVKIGSVIGKKHVACMMRLGVRKNFSEWRAKVFAPKFYVLNGLEERR